MTSEQATFRYKQHRLVSPENGPGQPHILEDADGKEINRYNWESTKTAHRLCDFVVTMLDNLKDYPKAIEEFFDASIKSFRFFRYCPEDKRRRPGIEKNIMIYRVGNEVTVSYQSRRHLVSLYL